MAFGPDGNLYVAQAYKGASAILQFNGALALASYTMAFLTEFVTPTTSAGLVHPYQPIFGPDGNLYVSSQDSNIVSGLLHGPSELRVKRCRHGPFCLELSIREHLCLPAFFREGRDSAEYLRSG